MPSPAEHYANHLGPVYSWMAGGVAAAIDRGAAELNAIPLNPTAGGVAVDLGAGFGMHAIPLARRGFKVLAIDSCAVLLEELRAHSGPLPIQTVCDDLLSFQSHLPESTAVMALLCMGDTLTHLADTESIHKLICAAATTLSPNAHFVITFRDYSSALVAEQRFISVRGDESRILTCFLDYADSHVTVYDLLHERTPSGWQLRVSSYQKLRLKPDWVVGLLEANGFTVRCEPGASGMVRLIAKRV
jgi:SAM-dependent methyltransferase